MSLFALGVIDPILVDRFTGFDQPSFVEKVQLLSDGLSANGPHEVLQSSGIPARTAQITGMLTAGDCSLIRDYDLTKEVVVFLDGNGNPYNVRVLELTTEDFTDWWTFTATLYCIDANIAPGS